MGQADRVLEFHDGMLNKRGEDAGKMWCLGGPQDVILAKDYRTSRPYCASCNWLPTCLDSPHGRDQCWLSDTKSSAKEEVKGDAHERGGESA